MGIVVHSHPAEDIRVHSALTQTHLCTLDARHRVTAAMKDYTADIILVNKLGGSIISMDQKMTEILIGNLVSTLIMDQSDKLLFLRGTDSI